MLVGLRVAVHVDCTCQSPKRAVRRESGVLWLTADPTHLAGRLNFNIHPFAVLTAVSYRIGDSSVERTEWTVALWQLCPQ